MEAIFLKLLNMSITASWLVVAVILLRLVLKKAPKIISLILWALVGVRLILPISLESVFSLIPSAQTFPSDFTTSTTPTIQTGIPMFNSSINPIISQSLAPNVGDSINPIQIVTLVASIVWVAGVAAMLLYALASYIRMRLKVREAVKSEGNIMVCDNIVSPFILGFIRPKIYVPSSIDMQDIYYVLAHENAHLKRRDHFWKPLGFFLLSVYWFNPVLWIAYILLCRDIELACDEKVIKSLGIEAKKPYSTALVNCSVSRKAITVCPLAFGEVGVKKRVKTVLNYKKPTFWLIIVALLICIAVAACFLTNPPSDDDTTTTKPTDTTTTTLSPYGEVKFVGTPLLWAGASDTPYIDSINCDIDGDGLTEEVRLYIGPTSGVSSYIISVWDNKVLEYSGFFSFVKGSWRFDKFENGILYITETVTKPNSNEAEISTLKLSVKDSNLSIQGDNIEDIHYSGNIMYSPISHTFDIDGDGLIEFCMVIPVDKYPFGLFRFIVLQNMDDIVPKYYEIYNYQSLYSLSFTEGEDGKIDLFGIRNGLPNAETAILDISVEDGKIILKENGKAITPYGTDIPPNIDEIADYYQYYYYFDEANSVSADINDDGKNETVSLGYMQYVAMATSSDKYKLYWMVRITDDEGSHCMSLDLHKQLSVEKDEHGDVFIKNDNGKIIGQVVHIVDEGSSGYSIAQAIK